MILLRQVQSVLNDNVNPHCFLYYLLVLRYKLPGADSLTVSVTRPQCHMSRYTRRPRRHRHLDRPRRRPLRSAASNRERKLTPWPLGRIHAAQATRSDQRLPIIGSCGSAPCLGLIILMPTQSDDAFPTPCLPCARRTVPRERETREMNVPTARAPYTWHFDTINGKDGPLPEY